MGLKIISLSFFVLLGNYSSFCQTFTISSVAPYNDIHAISIPMSLNSADKCIDLQTGVAIYYGTVNNGRFLIDCKLGDNKININIRIFPVPAKDKVTVQSVQNPYLKDVYNFIIYSVEGKVLLNKKETGYSLYQGLNFDIQSFPNGTYFLLIQSDQFREVFKFIKM